MELKPGYKQTEIGVLPEDWGVQTLADVAEKVMVGIASAATHAYRKKGIPLLRNQNIRAGYLDNAEILFVDPNYERTFRNKRLRSGDLLTARTGYPGMTCIVPPAYDGAQSFTTLITRPKANLVESAFLCAFINSAQGQRFFDQSQIGGAQKNVNAGTLRKMLVPVPRATEQRTIAKALSDVDGLLSGLDHLITKKRNLKQAAMQQLLTGQTRLPGFNGDWKVRRLGDVADIAMGQSPDSKNYNRIGDGVPLIQGNADIEDHRSIARVWTTQVTKAGRAGDLLLTVRAPVGAVGRISQNCCLGRGVCSLKARGDTDFLFHSLVFAETAWKLVEQGSTFSSANSTQVASFLLRMPATVSEQSAIAEVLTGMDAETAALEQRREKTRALKQAMTQELLTGETRFVAGELVYV